MVCINTPEELLDFMSNNINYGYLGKNGRIYHYDDSDFNDDWKEQYILETKDDIDKSLYGNCWDQVEYERDWFINHDYNIKTIYEMVLLDYDNDYPSHAFLVYEENNTWNWFENSDFDNRGIHTFNSFDELIEYQYNKYLKLLEKYNISDEEIKKIIITEFDKPREHSTSEEYIDFVINSKRIK